MTGSENLYFFRALDDKRCEVAKFTDGQERPSEVYELIHGSCTCFGATVHKVVCKHMKMYQWWVKQEKKPYAIDWDTMKAYKLGLFQ